MSTSLSPAALIDKREAARQTRRWGFRSGSRIDRTPSPRELLPRGGGSAIRFDTNSRSEAVEAFITGAHGGGQPEKMKSQERKSPAKKSIERLEAIITELQRLELPAGDVGSSLLDILEILEGIRAKTRIRAKALLSKAPAALPGWSVSWANPNGKRRAVGSLCRFAHTARGNALKLIRRRSPPPSPKNETRSVPRVFPPMHE